MYSLRNTRNGLREEFDICVVQRVKFTYTFIIHVFVHVTLIWLCNLPTRCMHAISWLISRYPGKSRNGNKNKKKATLRCPQCNAKVSHEDEFCGCGKLLLLDENYDAISDSEG